MHIYLKDVGCWNDGMLVGLSYIEKIKKCLLDENYLRVTNNKVRFEHSMELYYSENTLNI